MLSALTYSNETFNYLACALQEKTFTLSKHSERRFASSVEGRLTK